MLDRLCLIMFRVGDYCLRPQMSYQRVQTNVVYMRRMIFYSFVKTKRKVFFCNMLLETRNMLLEFREIRIIIIWITAIIQPRTV